MNNTEATTTLPTETLRIKTWEQRVQELEDLGADRSDAQAVVDAEDTANEPRVPETFAFANRMARYDRLTKAKQTMVANILKRNCIAR